MNILILEDDPNRVAQFEKKFNMDEIIVVDKASEAITKLTDFNWDCLFLDHDLGGEINVSTTNKNTGSEVARWLSIHKDRIPNLVIIHSMNPPGAANIKALLRDAVVLPMAWSSLSSRSISNPQDVESLKRLAATQSRRQYN